MDLISLSISTIEMKSSDNDFVKNKTNFDESNINPSEQLSVYSKKELKLALFCKIYFVRVRCTCTVQVQRECGSVRIYGDQRVRCFMWSNVPV
jgi:hypothetical protein